MENIDNQESSDNKVPIYAKIDVGLRDRAALYVTQSKILNKTETETFVKLIEESLEKYMRDHPL